MTIAARYAAVMPNPNLSVVDVPEHSRFELNLDGERVGLADYTLADDLLTIPHVETDPAHRGQGFAATLMAGVVETARERNLQIRPVCPYASSYLRARPDTHDLVVR